MAKTVLSGAGPHIDFGVTGGLRTHDPQGHNLVR